MGKKVIHGGLIIKGTLASGSGDDLLTIDATTGEVGKISGTPLTTTLTAANIIVGNVSNVATAVAMSGDVTISNAGVTAIGSGVIVNADVNASAAIAHSKMAALTASRALVSDGSGVVSAADVTATELSYLDGVTSAIQTQFSGKQATITGAATTVVSSNLTANTAVISNASGKLASSATTDTELGYVSGVTSAIQTQLNTKLGPTISSVAEGDILYYNGTTWVNLARGTNGQALLSTATTVAWGSATANGIAAGGTTGQVLAKTSGVDFEADWSTLVVASITDLTATAAELNILDGATIDVTELNYLDGVTSNIQSQLGNKMSSVLAHNAMFVGNASNVASSLAAGSEGQVLTVTSGVPTWQTVSVSGVTTLAALDGTTKSANGGAISGVNLYLQTADATYPGLVSTGTQTFAGAKSITATGVFNTTYQLSVNDAVRDLKLGVNSTGAEIQSFSVPLYLNPIGNNTILNSGGGSVGIGTTTPHAPLQFAPAIASRKIVLYEIGDNDHQFYGVGVNANVLRYQVDEAGSSHVFYAGASSTTSNELFRITGTGDVKIGSNSTGTGRAIYADGSGTDVALSYISKGTGSHVFRNVGNLSSVVIYPDSEADGSNSTIHAFGGTLTIGTASSTYAVNIEANNVRVAQSTAGSSVLEIESGNGAINTNIYQNTVTTTNNTATTILTIPTITNAAYNILVNIIGVRTGGVAGTAGDVSGYTTGVIYKNIGGTVSAVGGLGVVSDEENNVNTTYSFVVSGTNILVQVTGDTDNNYRWNCKAEVTYVEITPL